MLDEQDIWHGIFSDLIRAGVLRIERDLERVKMTGFDGKVWEFTRADLMNHRSADLRDVWADREAIMAKRTGGA